MNVINCKSVIIYQPLMLEKRNIITLFILSIMFFPLRYISWKIYEKLLYHLCLQ